MKHYNFLLKFFKDHINLNLVYLDKILIFFTILIMTLSNRPDLVIFMSFYFFIFYLYLTKRRELLKVLFTSFLFSLAWLGLSKDFYYYGNNFLSFFGISIYSLFSWTAGFMAIYTIYLHYENYLKKFRYIFRFFIFSFFYIFFLLFLEYIFYNFSGVQNLATQSYSGFLGCNCLHAPIWMQISYLVLGPIYFLFMEFIELKNPHFIKKNK